MQIKDHLKNDSFSNVLFIDDEDKILSALTRSLKDHPYTVFTASGWEDAEPILIENDIEVAVCDRKLKGACGIQLFEKLGNQFPDIVRIMLSGDIKTETILSSINHGHVYRFIPKPWDLPELITAIDDAISLHTLITERKRFEKELIALNMSLEEKVLKSTREMTLLYSELEQSFDTTISALLSILALHSNLSVSHVKRTAERVSDLCRVLDVSSKMERVARRAALLHWTGLTSVAPTFFETHLWDIPSSEKPVWEFHALLGQQALLPVPALQVESAVIANYLRPHQAPSKIQFICQILAASSFFEHALYVIRRGRNKIEKREINALHERFAKEYPFLDSVVLEALFASEKRKVRDRIESECDVSSLRKGMILSRAVSTTQGVALVPAEIVVDTELIETLREYHGELSSVFIWAEL